MRYMIPPIRLTVCPSDRRVYHRTRKLYYRKDDARCALYN